MLGGKQLDLRLHERKRRPQLVRGVPRELPLCAKALVKAVDHAVERLAELLELGQHVLADLHVRQIARLHVLNLRRKSPQRPERVAADEVRQHTAEQRHRNRDKPIGRTEGFLCVAHNDRKLFVELAVVGVERRGGTPVDVGARRYATADRVHVTHSRISDEAVHQHARHTHEKSRHQRDAPLQREPFHETSSIT